MKEKKMLIKTKSENKTIKTKIKPISKTSRMREVNNYFLCQRTLKYLYDSLKNKNLRI